MCSTKATDQHKYSCDDSSTFIIAVIKMHACIHSFIKSHFKTHLHWIRKLKTYCDLFRDVHCYSNMYKKQHLLGPFSLWTYWCTPVYDLLKISDYYTVHQNKKISGLSL